MKKSEKESLIIEILYKLTALILKYADKQSVFWITMSYEYGCSCKKSIVFKQRFAAYQTNTNAMFL